PEPPTQRRPDMRTTFAVIASLLFAIVPRAADAQDGKAALEAVAKAMGADIVTSVQYDASGTVWSLGQSAVPGGPWPKFNAKLSRSINYGTASMRDQLVRTQVENPPRGGSNQPVRGELRQVVAVNGDHSWTV